MKILIVDDSKMNIKIAEDALKSIRHDCDVMTANNGEEALEIIEEENIDLILLDIIMPGLTGVDLLSLMKQSDKLNHTKVIMMTTIDDMHIFSECFELGASDYIHKPFSTMEFSARVRAVLKTIEVQQNLMDAILTLQAENLELKNANRKLISDLRSI